MKFTLATTLALATASTVTALPFWGSHKAEEIPSLSVEEWQSIHDGSFAPSSRPSKEPQSHRYSVWTHFKALSGITFFAPTYDAMSEILDEVLAEIVDDDSEKTIWQLLQQDDKYSKVVKALNLEETGKAIKVLDDQSKSITFFAPENDGIPEPPHKKKPEDEDAEAALHSLVASPSLDSLIHFHSTHLLDDKKEPSDEDKKRWHEIFQYILRSILKYHGLTEALSSSELASNNTVASAFYPEFGTNDGEPLRIRIEKKLVPPSVVLNFYSKLTSEQKAKNGYLHGIAKPLHPPFSILNELFLFPKEFSIATSAIQKVHGEDWVDWNIDPKKSKKEGKVIFEGAPATTIFAPTNEAWGALPDGLLHFLFSPFGEHVLAKLLEYHALPRNVIFSEKFWDTKAPKPKGHHHKDFKHPNEISTRGDDPSFHEEWTLETGLKNQTVFVVVDKSKLLPIPGATKTTFTVNGIEASTFDVPALNGALHVLPKVLKPKHEHHDDDGELVESEWEDWESWIVEWADSA